MISTCKLATAILCAGLLALPAVAQDRLPKTAETFEINEHKAFVYAAPKPAHGNPWLWYAPTLNGVSLVQRKLYFDSLMQAGISIAGFDLGEVRGAPASTAKFSLFYEEMVKRGWSPKPILLGQSRGGLMMLAWGMRNPEKVRAFVGIYPVCNLASWPLKNSKAATLADFGMSEAEIVAQLSQLNPVDNLQGLLANKVPMFVVHGDSDVVVPYDDNTRLLKERYEAGGGPITVKIIPGEGHKVSPSFFECPELVDFILANMAAPAAEAQPPKDRPAPSAVRGSQYPLLHANGTVTFRVNAREAKQVQVVPRGTGNGLGDSPLALHSESGGVWTVTAPARPGFHYYQLRVDGFAGNDPSSQTFFGWAQETSGLEVPDAALDFYSPQEVPHGDVRICTYQARSTGGPRRVYVYTPPGYDEQPTRRYPVLYLQHGAGESERAWTEQGKANVILDNLIASGRAEPMLVVMENGYATPHNQPAAASRPTQPDLFSDLVVNDLVPFIDGKFRTLALRDQRAIAGLSMGGGQAMRIGLANLDQFAWIGSFSGALRDFHIETSYGEAFRDAAEANRRLRLLWIGCGTEDRLIEGARQIHQLLAEHKIEHVWLEQSGSHEWQVWRKHLFDFAPRLFKGN